MANGKGGETNHSMDDGPPLRPKVERGRAPNLNQECPGHGDQSTSGQVGGGSKGKDPGGFGHMTTTTATDADNPLKDSAHAESFFTSMDTIKSQEGVERVPMQLSTSRMATTPPERCMCQCTCINCLCNRNMSHDWRHFANEGSGPPSHTDTPPSSLLSEDDRVSEPMPTGPLPYSNSNSSEILHGINGGNEDDIPPQNEWNPPILIEAAPSYACSLSGSEFETLFPWAGLEYAYYSRHDDWVDGRH